MTATDTRRRRPPNARTRIDPDGPTDVDDRLAPSFPGGRVDFPISDEGRIGTSETAGARAGSSDAAGLAGDVDPRIAARRAAVVSQAMSRRRRIVVGVAAAVALAVAAVLVVRSPLFGVRDVAVIGDPTSSAAAVLRDAGLRRGMPLISIDEATAAARLLRSAEYLDAAVTTRWPGTVEVRVTRRPVIAVFIAGGRRMIVGRGGVAMPATADVRGALEVTVEGSLPRVSAGRTVPAALASIADTVAATPLSLRARTQTITMSSRSELTYGLVDGAELRFGNAVEASDKFLAAVTMLGGRVDLDGMCRLDVRVPTDPKIRRGGDCDAATDVDDQAADEPVITEEERAAQADEEEAAANRPLASRIGSDANNPVSERGVDVEPETADDQASADSGAAAGAKSAVTGPATSDGDAGDATAKPAASSSGTASSTVPVSR
ncbi:MAG: FtsQ-type POTRA domain-containing protein [Actinobacteria bacterium]|nr:FtsQ-type POTRA domain-containing protein [Actinomycetota bacterium]